MVTSFYGTISSHVINQSTELIYRQNKIFLLGHSELTQLERNTVNYQTHNHNTDTVFTIYNGLSRKALRAVRKAVLQRAVESESEPGRNQT